MAEIRIGQQAPPQFHQFTVQIAGVGNVQQPQDEASRRTFAADHDLLAAVELDRIARLVHEVMTQRGRFSDFVGHVISFAGH